MYNDNNPNPLEGHNPDSIPVVAARKPVLTMDALNWIKSNPKEKEEVKEKEKTFFEQLQAKMMQFEMEKLLAQMQQQRLQQPSNQVAKFKLGGTTGGTSVEEVKKVKAIQAKLKAAGFYNGKVDGAWGPKTQEAYTAFEDASNAGCEGEDCNDPFSEGPGSTQAHNGMYNNPPDVNKGAGVIAEMLTGAGLPDNVSFMLTHLLTGNSVVPTGDTQGYGYPNQRTQLELYRAIQNNEKAGKTKPSKTGKRGISYEDYSADIAKKALNNSELDVLTLLGGSLLSDKFNAATTYGQVSYDRDPKDPHIIRVYDNYDFNGKRDAREGENLYRKVRRGVGNTSAILNKESINKAQYIGSYDTRVWDKISEVGIDPHAPMPTNILPRVNSTEYPKFAYGGEVIEVDSLTPAERKWYLENGYDIEEDGVMEYAKGGPVDGYMLPEVEIKAKRRVGSSTVSLTPSDQPTNSEFKKKDNIKENLKWLAMLTADTATDQIPNSEHVKMAYDGYKGNPITGLMNYAKIPAPIILDMLINMIQNNPTGIDTEHLDGYFKGQFKDKSLSNKVSNQYAKGGKVQSYKGGGKINPDEVVTFGEYKNVPFGMLSPEAQQEYKDSKSREIATGVKTEKSSSTRTDIKAGSTEHNVHVSAFPNPDKPLKEHGNPKTTKALRTLSGVDKNELQKSLAVDDLDLLYTLEQEFANNPAYNYSWYHKSKDIWPSAHVPTKQDTVNYNAMLGAVNDYGSKDYHVNDSSYTPTTGDVIRSILGYPAVEHSNGMSIQDMSMLPAELAHRYQQNNGLLNTQRFLTDVVTKGGLGMNYRALYDDATSFEGEAHSLIEPVLKEEFSVRQAREKLRLDGAKIVPTSDEDLVEQSRKTIQKVLSQYAKGGSVQQYPGGSKVYDDKTSQMLIVDKDNMQIFNTKGEQLDWDDFKDRTWATINNLDKPAALINAQQKNLQSKRNTTEEKSKLAEEVVNTKSTQIRIAEDTGVNLPYNKVKQLGPSIENASRGLHNLVNNLQLFPKDVNSLKEGYSDRQLKLQTFLGEDGMEEAAQIALSKSKLSSIPPYSALGSIEHALYSPITDGMSQEEFEKRMHLNDVLQGGMQYVEEFGGLNMNSDLYKEGKDALTQAVKNKAKKNLKHKVNFKTYNGTNAGAYVLRESGTSTPLEVGVSNGTSLDLINALQHEWAHKSGLDLLSDVPGVDMDKFDKNVLRDKIGLRYFSRPEEMFARKIGRQSGGKPYVLDQLDKETLSFGYNPLSYSEYVPAFEFFQNNDTLFYDYVNPKYKYGGQVIDEYEVDSMTPEQIVELQAQGYDVEVDGVMHYAKGGGVNDPLKDVTIGGIPFYLAPVEAQNKYLQTMLPSPTLPNDNWVYKEQDKTPSKTKDFTAAQDNTRVDIKTSKKIPYKKPDLLPTDKEFAERNERYDSNRIARAIDESGVGNLANNLFNASMVVDGAMLGEQLLKYGVNKALTSYGKEAFTPDLGDVGMALRNPTKSTATVKPTAVAKPWQMQELPGLHLKSTMEGDAISKIVEPKTGLVNVEQALAIIGKESGGADKVALIRQSLGDKLPKKMDYNEFRKVVQKQLIPLERQFASDRSNYGIHSLGYPMPKRSSFESAVFHAEKDIADLQSKIQEASKLERVFIDGTPAYRFKGRYGEELFRSKDEALFAQKKAISDMTESLEISNSNLKTTQATMKNLPLENQTLILGNKSKLGKGSNAHGNPDETLGHIHFLRDKESPDVLTVTQIQSDAFQGTHRIPMKQEAESLRRLKELKEGSLYNYNNTLDYYKELFENAKLKTRPDGSKHYGLFDKNGEVIDFISEAEFKKGHKYYTDKVFNFEDMLQYSDEISSKTQKQLLDKNHQERYLQELVDYAGKRGDVNKVRVPTDRTAAKIQGYSKDYTHAHPPDRDTHEVLSVIEDWRNKGKSIEDVISIFEKEITYRKLTPEEVKEVTSLYKLNAKGAYSTEQQTILKKYSEQPKTIKKLFGKEPTIVTDSKGNTWYEFDIPDKFKKGKGEIKAFSIAPYALPTLGATGVAAAASQDKKNK